MRSRAFWLMMPLLSGALGYGLFSTGLFAAWVSGSVAPYATGEMKGLEVQRTPAALPSAAVQNASGQRVALASLLTAPVTVINLWATWCAPCVKELPSLEALARRNPDRVRVLTISVDTPDEDIASFLARYGTQLPALRDPNMALTRALGASGVPMTVIVDAQGREWARLAGGADWASEDAQAVIDAVLKNAPER